MQHNVSIAGSLRVLALTSVLLSGCAVIPPDLGEAPAPRTASSLDSARSLTAPPTDWPDKAWWSHYGDPQLVTLIDEAVAGSPDLAAATARLRMAEALAEQAGASRLPSAAVDGTAGYAKQSYNNGVPPAFVPHGWNDTGRTALTVGFDLDLWGRNRATLAAATSEAEAARVEAEAARLTLATNVAAAYATLAQLYADRDVAESAVRIRGDSLQLVERRLKNGLETLASAKQAAAAVPAARAELAAIDESIALTRNRIAALIGTGPDRGLTIQRPAVGRLHAVGVPANLGLDLIGRRPDIIAARLRAEAEADRIKAARADFYPNINLSAVIGLQSLGLSKLTDSGSSYGTVAPAVNLPIFDGGQRSGRYRQARATYDEAVASYDRTLTEALHDVADVVASQRALSTRLTEAKTALADSEQAYAIAKQRYEGGLSTYLTVLSTEEGLLAQRRTVADLEARAFILDVDLVRALGGGFTQS
ncbi:efflux transporter outer membrane subunit [Oleisolibacter albus]|uniref:efflux transporter outer membrane subunit n=1 Tax=Oleisolibacter albus TaxID=2171757 RepID=UPI000DF1545D|nr:efflux transporter outer membrane subunit [Oleisolibacter albus]